MTMLWLGLIVSVASGAATIAVFSWDQHVRYGPVIAGNTRWRRERAARLTAEAAELDLIVTHAAVFDTLPQHLQEALRPSPSPVAPGMGISAVDAAESLRLAFTPQFGLPYPPTAAELTAGVRA